MGLTEGEYWYYDEMPSAELLRHIFHQMERAYPDAAVTAKLRRAVRWQERLAKLCEELSDISQAVNMAESSGGPVGGYELVQNEVDKHAGLHLIKVGSALE